MVFGTTLWVIGRDATMATQQREAIVVLPRGTIRVGEFEQGFLHKEEEHRQRTVHEHFYKGRTW